MINIGARSIIYSLKYLFLPDNELNKRREAGAPSNAPMWCRGFGVTIDTRIYHQDCHENGKQDRRFIHILIVGDHNAFVAHSSIGVRDPEWVNVGNHDTCWIDSVETELNRIYFDMCKAVDDTVAPRELNQQTWLSIFGNDIKFVEAQMAYDDERNTATGCHVWKKVTALKELTLAEFAAYNKESE